MSADKETQTYGNDSETSSPTRTGLTQERSGFDLEDTRRELIAMRKRHGAQSPVGHRISNLIEQC